MSERKRGEMGGFMGYRFLQCPYIAYSCKYPIDKLYIYAILFIDEKDIQSNSSVRITKLIARSNQKEDCHEDNHHGGGDRYRHNHFLNLH